MKPVITIFVVFLSALVSFAQTELTDDNVEAKLIVDNDRLIVLDFYATWCGPCKYMEPIIEALEIEYKSQVDFYKMDVDKNQLDDSEGITAIPTYLFIKNGYILEKVEGAMSKSELQSLVKKYLETNTEISTSDKDENIDVDDFSQKNIDRHWNSSYNLNYLAWNAYENSNDINILLKAIKMVERAIELEKNYSNLDTYAALLYKTGNYKQALKRAKEAVDIAKVKGVDYSSTTELIDKIIENM